MAIGVDGRGVGKVGEGSSASGPGVPGGASDGKAMQAFLGGEPVTRSRLGDAAGSPSHPSAQVVPPDPQPGAVPVRWPGGAAPGRCSSPLSLSTRHRAAARVIPAARA